MRRRASADAITGFIELGAGRLEAVAVAELQDGMLVAAGQVKFGLAGKELWQRLARLRAGPETCAGLIPVRPELVAGVKFCDGGLLSVG